MNNKLKKVVPDWHRQISDVLNREAEEVNELTERAKHRRLRLGFMFIFVKEQGKSDGSIPHGQFGDWLRENCPAISRSTAGQWITEARSLCKFLRWENSEIRNFEPHRLLASSDDSLTEADRKRRASLLEIADNSEKYRAVTEYKQVELDDDEIVSKRGRAKGEGGSAPRIGKTVEETIELNKGRALRQMGVAADALERLHVNFLSQPDAHIAAFLGALERSARCARQWLSTPPAQRDITKIAKLWKTKE